MRITVLLTLAGGSLGAAQPHVVVSIAPYADLVERLAGPDATVHTLLPPGATPHAFDASPRDLARIADADLVVVNGGLDTWVLDLLAGAGRDVPVFVALESLEATSDLREDGEAHDGEAHDHHEREAEDGDHGVGGEHDHGDGGEHEHDHGDGINPHVWLDPLLMTRVVPELAEALGEVDAANASNYERAAEQLVGELEALHRDLTELLEPVAGAPFVPFHDAWPHFAERYGLDLVVEIEPFPGREPSARELAEAIDLVRASGARAIFNEIQLADRPARVLADEAGVEVATLDPLGGVEGRTRYEDLLRYNAQRVVDALTAE